MDNAKHAEFFNHTTDEIFFASLSDEQRSGLDNFYHAHANTTRRDHYQRYIERDGKKIWTPQAMIGRTAHHTYIAMYNSISAGSPEDYDLQAYRLENNLQPEKYAVSSITTNNPNRRVVYAKSIATGHKASIVIEMGRQVLWVEAFTVNGHQLLLPLHIHPVKASDILLDHQGHEA